MDKSADDVIREIKEFATAESSSRLLVLAVMCHGDGHDNMSFIEKCLTSCDLMRELDEERESPPEVRKCT